MSEEVLAAKLAEMDTNSDGDLSNTELRAGYLKYSMLRQAVVAVVKTLVKKGQWARAPQPGHRR